MRARGQIEDRPYMVTAVAKVGNGSITTEDGWSIGCDLEDVRVGELVEFWGKGIGYQVRGLAVGGRVAWYRTEEEQLDHQLEQQAEAEERRIREFEEKRADLDAAFDALPEAFQRRIQRFRDAAGPEWRWKFEPYESFVCTEAVKFAEYCARTGTTLGAFAKDSDAQRDAGIADGHSGNTFSCAVELARLWPNPDMLVAAHGALVPLVGCDEYGCRHEVPA